MKGGAETLADDPHAAAALPAAGPIPASDQAPVVAAMAHRPFDDIPSWIWRVFLAAWATFFALMFAFFATGAEATFAVIVSMLFGMMAFGLPIALSSQSRGPDGRREAVVRTHTGPLGAGAAGVQIALIPVAVVIGVLGFVLLAK